jgi:selenocysteine-specific elongation factor
MDRIKKILSEQPMSPPDLKEIEKQLGVTRNKLVEVIRLLERDGSVTRVATDLYYLSSTVDEVRAILKKFIAERGEIAAASFRDLIGSSRKYTIPLLEYFDREGTTIRIGDIRRLKSSASAAK